jgi:hypothetical protein
MFSWVISGMTHIQTELPADELFRLALATLSIEPKRVVNRVAPGGISTAGAASIVALGSEAEAMFADIADDGLLDEAES